MDEADWKPPADAAVGSNFALTIATRHTEDNTGRWRSIQHLDIRSPHLVKGFRTAVKYFPGIGLESSRVSFMEPFKPLFFILRRYLRDRGEGCRGLGQGRRVRDG